MIDFLYIHRIFYAMHYILTIISQKVRIVNIFCDKDFKNFCLKYCISEITTNDIRIFPDFKTLS